MKKTFLLTIGVAALFALLVNCSAPSTNTQANVTNKAANGSTSSANTSANTNVR